MRAIVEREPFLALLERVSLAVDPKATFDIMRNCALFADGERLRVVGTNLDIEIEGSIGSDVEEPGSCCISMKRLLEAVKHSSGADVTIASDPKVGIRVAIGRSRFDLPTLLVSDYPVRAARAVPICAFDLPAHTLADVESLVSFAALPEGHVRHFATGTHISIQDDKLEFVASDGAKLCILSTDLPAGAEDMPAIIIPTAALVALRRIENGGSLRLEVSDAMVRGLAGEASLTAKLIDGSFPPYRLGIPADLSDYETITVEAETLARSMKRLSEYGETNDRGIAFRADGSSLGLSAGNANGDAFDEIDILGGGHVEIGFSFRHLKPVIDSFRGKRIEISARDEAPTAILRDPDDPRRTILVGRYSIWRNGAAARAA